MITLTQWRTRTQSLKEHLARTTQRTKEVLMRARKLGEKAEVETNLKNLRAGIDKK